MKNRRFLTAIICLSFVSFSHASCDSEFDTANTAPVEDKGDTGGNGGTGGGRTYAESSYTITIATTPTTFALNPGSNIDVNFGTDLGTVNVKLINNYGITVYNKTVDTTTNSALIINISNLPAGSYNLSITNNEGKNIVQAVCDL